MTVEQMSRAIGLHREAAALKRQFDGWVLLAIDCNSKPEVVNVGDPVQYKQGSYHRAEIKISDAIRRLAFRQWRKEIAVSFNAKVRELNQMGVRHELALIDFSPATGEPA